jgi:hypothetical protein
MPEIKEGGLTIYYNILIYCETFSADSLSGAYLPEQDGGKKDVHVE